MGTELLTAGQMRALEQAAIAAGLVTGLALMERAGAGVVEAILSHWPELAQGAAEGEEGALPPPLAATSTGSRTDGAPMDLPPAYVGQDESGRRAVVLCGPGNNGGDGYVIARLLRDLGWAVAVFALAPPVTADAAAMAARWGGDVRPLTALDWPHLQARPLVVDAMFGGGLSRDIAPGVWGALSMAVSCRCRIVAVDMPSGLCADSGRIRSAGGWLDHPVDLTVTFQRPRTGHMLLPAAEFCGRLVVVPLGLEPVLDDLLRSPAGEAVVDQAGPGGRLGKMGGHKFDHGHALVLAGGPGQGGAARLAARAALRIGAGLVTLACPPGALAENAARLDAVMLRPLADAAAVTALLGDTRISALCLGPGMGLEGAAAAQVAAALAARRATVLDADALTLIARDPALFAALHGACVLTPHGGEFARLFPDIAARLAAPVAEGPALSKLDATRAAAARAGCVVLFKGADTVIADPAGRAVIHAAAYDRAAPWLATAGAGDVLAGFIAGLLARGLPGFDAACAAAWLHVSAARRFGPGLIAEDLPEMLPQVFRDLGL